MCKIELQKCTYIYQPGSVNEHEAIHELDLRIENGEMLAVVGRGGSGKSTLSLLLSGLYRPNLGTVLLNDEPVSHGDIFPQVGLVFQYPEQQLFADTVYEEIAFGLKNHGVADSEIEDKVHNALNAVDLDHQIYAQRSPFALSGGQKRRVAIACMLAISPQVFIFDEPTAGLDGAGRKWVQKLLSRLNAMGHTVVWVSHDMAEVAEIAQRMIVMEQGRILADGSPAQVFAKRDLLQQAGLALPPAAELIQQLISRGADLPGNAVTAKDACGEIVSWMEDAAHV